MKKLWGIALAFVLVIGLVAGSAFSPIIHLVDLNDVDPTGLSDGQVLAWNATAGKFQPMTISGGGGGSGSSISNGGGSASINTAGNFVISRRVDSVDGVA